MMSTSINKYNPPVVMPKTAFYFLAALIYGLLLASLPNELFRDRENYVVYASNFAIIFKQYNAITLLFNEPLFLLYNKVLSLFFPRKRYPELVFFSYHFRLLILY